MELFERIRHDHREEGLSVRALARRHNVHRRDGAPGAGVRGAAAAGDAAAGGAGDRALDAATIRAWLTDDQEAPRKQRHTARRIWERLVDEHGGRRSPRAPSAECVRELRAELGTGPASRT